MTMSSPAKPFSEACERNREAILTVLTDVLAGTRTLLEIGTGTGQHAVFFGRTLPHIQWQTSDLPESSAGINLWLESDGSDNVLAPITLDVTTTDWHHKRYDAVFSANTVHIMGWPAVGAMFTGVGKVLNKNGRFCLYGPFNSGGRYTSESNAQFDAWLKARDPHSGIRNLEDLDALATRAGMQRLGDYPMPANNRIIVWQRGG